MIIAAVLSALGLGGFGVATYLLGPAAMLGFGKSIFGFLAEIPWQVYAIAALAGLIAFLFISRGHWIDRAHGDEARISSLCQATRDAAANPTLDCKDTDAQIKLLGQAVSTLKGELARQNAAITALGQQTAQERAAAEKAYKIAQERAQEAQAISQRLEASSRSAPAQAASCAPSKALSEQWQ